MDTFFQNKISSFIGKNSSFAGTGSRQDKNWAFGGSNSFFLVGIEMFQKQIIHDTIDNHSIL